LWKKAICKNKENLKEPDATFGLNAALMKN
jgi:hypothetical protein